MKDIIKHPFWDSQALLIARILMGVFFLINGISKLQDITGTAGYIAAFDLPAPILLAWATALFETAAGIAVIIGKYFKEATLLLAAFSVVVSFPFHNPSVWADSPVDKIMFMKNMAIAAGLLYMASHGPGRTWSLGKK
jgi:putative oxidoreductase